VLSVIESQRTKQAQVGEEDLSKRDMSGELQTIPARHGVATFVPRGRTIKIINTYGKQVVSTWAFGLHAPPQEGEEEEEEEEEKEVEAMKEEAEVLEKHAAAAEEEELEQTKKPTQEDGNCEEKSKSEQESAEEAEDPPEQAPETPPNEKTTENTNETPDPKAGTKMSGKRTWSSYLPSIPYRSKGKSTNSEPKSTAQKEKEEKEKSEAASKKWSSYLPTGQSFSSYVPNVQIPDSNTVISAFKASHYREPNKSYAEQLYDFSKTPVGAGSIAGTFSRILLFYSSTELNSCNRLRNGILTIRCL